MLSLSDITIQFKSQPRALVSHISLDVEEGKHVVLLGGNGSGKSSLMLCALGFLRPSCGTAFVDGHDMNDPHQVYAGRRLLGYVGQKPDDGIVATRVEDEVAFGPENLGLDRAEIRARVDEALHRVGLDDFADREPHALSGGQKQRLVIAGALAMHPRYLLFDEPGSMLDPRSRGYLLELIARERARGLGILHITHDISEARHADEIVVLYEGEIAFRGTYDELIAHEDSFEAWGIEREIPVVERPYHATDETQFALENAQVIYKQGDQRVEALKPASLELKKGEFIVVEGHTGSGKSTLMKMLAGLIEPTSGAVAFEGAPLTARTARGVIGLVFQNPESALFGETVLEDVAFGPRNFGASEEDAHRVARETLEHVGLDPQRFGERSPLRLSGGEARKVALAGILSFSPRVILADEPTAALDARGRLAVRKLLAEASREATVIVVTHTPAEFDAMADRVFHLEEGVIEEVTR